MRRLHTPFLQFQPGDWNGFLTLVTDNLAKIMILPAILIGTFQFSSETMSKMVDIFVVHAYYLPNSISPEHGPTARKLTVHKYHIWLAQCRPTPLEENTVS